MKKKFRSFSEARKFAQSLKLKNRNEWDKYCKSGKRPNDIPSYPNRPYKKTWKGMGDWLGTGIVANLNKKFRSFEEARKFVHKLGLKNSGEWRKYCKSGKRPNDIPGSPEKSYKKEWISMGDWLGTGFVATQSRKFLPFKEAKKFARKTRLKSKSEWSAYSKSGKLPHNIPSNPNLEYKKEWKDWGDWLGSGTIAPQIIAGNYLPFKEAQKEYQKLAKQYGLNGRNDWKQFASTHKKLVDDLRIPSEPWRAYSKERVSKRRNK